MHGIGRTVSGAGYKVYGVRCTVHTLYVGHILDRLHRTPLSSSNGYGAAMSLNVIIGMRFPIPIFSLFFVWLCHLNIRLALRLVVGLRGGLGCTFHLGFICYTLGLSWV